MRGQAFDECAAINGNINGAQAIIQRKSPKGLYKHCSSHTLNLVVCPPAHEREISNCLGTIKKVTNLWRALQRGWLFSTRLVHVFRAVQASSVRLRRNTMGWTSWGCCLVCWDDTSRAWNVRGHVIMEWHCSLFKRIPAVTDQRFLVAVCICARFSSLLLPLLMSLQQPTIDLTEWTSQVSDVVASLNICCEEADDDFKQIFFQATELSGEAITIPRTASRQSNSSNYTTNEPEVFHRQSFYLPYLDGRILQLTERLSVNIRRQWSCNFRYQVISIQ